MDIDNWIFFKYDHDTSQKLVRRVLLCILLELQFTATCEKLDPKTLAGFKVAFEMI